MIITGQNIFPIATQKNLSYNINFTPKDFSLSTISFKENKDFTFTLQSGKFSDINNKSVYFYNTGENINLSGNIHHLQQNNFNSWTGSEKFLYDYYINGNPIILSGQRTGLMNNDPTGYSKISGLTFSGSNLELTNFQIFGVSPLINLELAPSFAFGKLITGFLNYTDNLQESCRILSGSVIPTGFNFNSIPQTLTGLGLASGGFNINTNFSPSHSATPLIYNITLNLLTDFGLLSKTFVTTGLPEFFTTFFISVNPFSFNLFNIPSGITYDINSSFFSGGNEYAKSIDVGFNYAEGTTGVGLDSASFYGSGTRNFALDIVVTGTGNFTLTGQSLASGFAEGVRIFGTGNLSGSFQTGITGGNFQKVFMISGSGHANTNHFNLTTFIISGYRTGVLSSGTIVGSGTLTGYVYPFLSGSGTATFSNGFRSILNSNVPLGIVRSTQIFTGNMIYRISNSGTVKITGFNSTYLDYTGYTNGILLTGLLDGSGFIYSPVSNINVTGILRSEVNNRRITGVTNLQIVDFVLNTGINLARIVAIVSGEATGNYLNNPDIFGIQVLGTGRNVITGSNIINGSGLITGFNTGFIIKDNFITTGLVSGVVFYQATGDSNNPSNPNNFVQGIYNTIQSGNRLYSGFSLDQNLTFTGELTSPIRFTGNIVEFGKVYSNPVSLTGRNTIIYPSYTGIIKTGTFTRISNNIILERNTYFTGSSNYIIPVFATGISSGLNDTFYYWQETVAASNKIFTGFITIGSGNLITSPVNFGTSVSASGILSGQVGTDINYIAISQTVLNPHVTQINNLFFTGTKREIRDVILSGVASGTKYNFVGLNVSGSGFLNSLGSGFLTGSGIIVVTGFGRVTGADGTIINSNITGNVFVELSGNSNNINDPINKIFIDQSLFATGTGFFNIKDQSITGLTTDEILLSNVSYIEVSGFRSLTGVDSYGTGLNLADLNQIYSGVISRPSRISGIYYTGISIQQIDPNPYRAVVTGLNETILTDVLIDLKSSIRLSGYITGTGIISKNITTGISGKFPDSINPYQYLYFTGKSFNFNVNQVATGTFRVTGRFDGFTGIYTGILFERPGFIPYFGITGNILNSKNFLGINQNNEVYYHFSVSGQNNDGISGIDILNISGKENIFLLGSYSGFISGAFSTENLLGNKYAIMPYQVGGSGNLTGLYTTLTGIIQFPKDKSNINKIIFTNNYIIFGGNFREYIDVKNLFTSTPTKGGIAINLTGGFVSNWNIDPNNDDNTSTLKDIVFVDKDKVLLAGNFKNILSQGRNFFAMVDFRGDGAFPDDNTNLSGINLNLKIGSVNSIIYNTEENNKFSIVGDFYSTTRTGEELRSQTISANNNFYARPKTSKRINPLLLKSDFTGRYDISDKFYQDYAGIADYGYTVDFECPELEDGPTNMRIDGYKKIEGNYYYYGKFNNVGSRFRKGFGAFSKTSGFIKNANVNFEGTTECLESSGNFIFVGGSIRSYGGIPYKFGGNNIDHATAGYAIKNQLTIDRSFVPIQPWNGGYAIYDIKTYNDKIYVVGDFDHIRMPTGDGASTSSMNRRSSFAVFDLSGNILPEALHFTQYGGDYKSYGGYNVRSLFITGSTGYFGGNFESVVGDGPESNLPIGTSIRYSGFRTAAFNLNTLHPITGYTGHFDGDIYQIDHFTGDYLIAVGTFDNYYRPFDQFSKPIKGACVLNRFNGTGIFESGACPSITEGYINETHYNDLRGYYRRNDGHYYLYGRLYDSTFNNLGLMLFNGTKDDTSINQFGAIIGPNNPITGFKFMIYPEGNNSTDFFINSVLENGNDLLVGGHFMAVSGRNSTGIEYVPGPYDTNALMTRATGLVVINKNSGMLVNTGINIGLLRRERLDSNWDEVFDIKRYNNKIFVGGRFRHFKADGENDPSGIAAGKFAVFDTGYNIERSLSCNTYDINSYIYKIYSGNNRAYLVGRHFGNGDGYSDNNGYSFSVQSPKYWDYVGTQPGEVGRIGLVQLNRSGYELPLTLINLSGIYLNNANEKINVIRKHESGLFLGGNFTAINGVSRTGLAWIDYNAIITNWNPKLTSNFGFPTEVKDMFISGNSLIFVGNFSRVNSVNRAGMAQVAITGMGNSIGEVSNLNLNSAYGFSNDYVNVIYNDDATTGYYVGGNFTDGLIKINKNTLNISSLSFNISSIYKSGIKTINKLNDIYFVGGNFVGFLGNNSKKDLVCFRMTGESITSFVDTPMLSISGVSDIEIDNNDIYVISNNSSRSYKFNLNTGTQKINLDSSWTPYFSKYSSNDSNYNLEYLTPSRASKALITGEDIYVVGDFHNASYSRNNVFATNKSGILITGFIAEFLTSADQTIDRDTNTYVSALSYDTGNKTLIIGGNFKKVNDTFVKKLAKINLINNTTSGFIQDLHHPQRRQLLQLNDHAFVSDIETLGSNTIIGGNFNTNVQTVVTGGNSISTGSFSFGEVILSGFSLPFTGAVEIYSWMNGVYDQLTLISGGLPYNQIYTGVSGSISNATGWIQIGNSPQNGNYFNISIDTGIQYSIDGTVFLSPGGQDYFYGPTLDEPLNQFSNINELYFLITGGGLIDRYTTITFDNVLGRISFFPKTSGTFGNSGKYNLIQNGNSFVIENFSGGKDLQYLATVNPKSPFVGYINQNILFTGTGYYEQDINAGTYFNDNIFIKTTGLWSGTGFGGVYNSGVIFYDYDKGIKNFYNIEIPNRTVTITGWGTNTSGESSNGIDLNPVDVRYIGAGNNFSIAQLNNGTITGWGDNTFNQLLGGTGLSNVKQLSVGTVHVLALLNNNTVTGWGNNSSMETTGLNGSALTLTGVKQVSAGNNFSLAILNNDVITGWGSSSFFANTGLNGSALTLTGIKQVSAGGNYGLALYYDGRVTGWGSNLSNKALGGNNLTNVQEIYAGFSHALALLDNNIVTGWGSTSLRRLAGNGLSGVLKMSTNPNGSISFALFNNYKLTGWGNDNTQSTTGINNAALNLTNIYDIAAGITHGLALYKFNSLNNLEFRSANSTGDILRLYADNPMTGRTNRLMIGSGITTGYLLSRATGSFIESSGNVRYVGLKTGFNEFIITGSHINYNNNINITGRLSTIFDILYTGTSLIQDINSVSYVGRVERTGFVNINRNLLVNSSFESDKLFIATGFRQINSGILFSNSNQGKIPVTGIILTGSGFVTLPSNVFPVSNTFSGIYNFISTGTGLMTFSGEYKHGGIARVTGQNNFITTGYINATGTMTFVESDFGAKSLNVIFTGIPNTGTLIPINTINRNAWSIRSGFNHIGQDFITVLGSGNMTGFLTGSFSITGSTGISGNLEYVANYTGILSGLVTGFRQNLNISVSNPQTLSYVTTPYNINTGQIFTENSITINQTLTRTGIFNFTGNVNTTGLYRSKTNFIITGLSTGYFPITGTGIVNLSGFVIAPQITTSGFYDLNGVRNNLIPTIGVSGTGINFPATIIINHDTAGHGGFPIAWSGSNDLINWNDIVLFKIGYYNNQNAGFRPTFINFTGFNRPFTGVTGLPPHSSSLSPSEIVTSGWRSTTEGNSLGIYSGQLNYRYFRTAIVSAVGGGSPNGPTGTITIINSPQITYDFTNYPYPSGNSIAYLDLTPISKFSGNFISGIKITGLYTKNYVGLFSGSTSGSFTGTWSGTGTFTGSQTITFLISNTGLKINENISQTLINSGLESGLVPVFTIGLYSGLKTIQNISINENRNITGSGYFERISSGFALAGTTSGSGIGLVTGYFSGFINKNYTGGINLETGLRLTGHLSGDANIVLTGLFTGTIALTGRIINPNFNLRSSGIATGYYLATKTFTGGFELYTGVSITGEFIKINPTSPTGWQITTNIKTGQRFYFQINSRNIFDEISGYFNTRVFSGNLTGSVNNNIIYASRLL
jgi:alpha-tubulin suppressor-like RCC1 family protein